MSEYDSFDFEENVDTSSRDDFDVITDEGTSDMEAGYHLERAIVKSWSAGDDSGDTDAYGALELPVGSYLEDGQSDADDQQDAVDMSLYEIA